VLNNIFLVEGHMGYLLLAMGLFVIICTYFKPRIYWESGKARRLRRFVGDQATEIFYYLIGLFILGASILVLLDLISLH